MKCPRLVFISKTKNYTFIVRKVLRSYLEFPFGNCSHYFPEIVGPFNASSHIQCYRRCLISFARKHIGCNPVFIDLTISELDLEPNEEYNKTNVCLYDKYLEFEEKRKNTSIEPKMCEFVSKRLFDCRLLLWYSGNRFTTFVTTFGINWMKGRNTPKRVWFGTQLNRCLSTKKWVLCHSLTIFVVNRRTNRSYGLVWVQRISSIGSYKLSRGM